MSESKRNTESLVAYLDGELAPSESQKIESQLAQDSSVRREIDTLSRTWDMLDSLDEVRASEAFTNKTLTSIQAAKSSPQPIHTTGSWKRWLCTFAICAGIVAVTTHMFRSNYDLPVLDTKDRQLGGKEQHDLLRDLELVENLHVYEEVDVEFANKLHESGLFDE